MCFVFCFVYCFLKLVLYFCDLKFVKLLFLFYYYKLTDYEIKDSKSTDGFGVEFVNFLQIIVKEVLQNIQFIV